MDGCALNPATFGRVLVVSVLGVTAAFYNPIVAAHLGREVWTLVNLATIVVAIASGFRLRPTTCREA